MEFLRAELHRFLQKKCNRTKFPFFIPKSFVIQRNLAALRLLMYPYTDSYVCSNKNEKLLLRISVGDIVLLAMVKRR